MGDGSRAFSAGQVRLRDQLIRVGTDLAYEVGVEEGEATLAGERVAFNQRVTNIYRREGGEWKMVHHHSDRFTGDERSAQPPPAATTVGWASSAAHARKGNQEPGGTAQPGASPAAPARAVALPVVAGCPCRGAGPSVCCHCRVFVY